MTDVELFVGDGDIPVKRFRTGDDVRVRMHYRATTRSPQPVFGFVDRADRLGGRDRPAHARRWRRAGVHRRRRRGRGALPDVPLLPGTYDLHTNITDFNRQHVYDNLHLAVRFDVMTGTTLETGGSVTLRPEWTVG